VLSAGRANALILGLTWPAPDNDRTMLYGAALPITVP